MKGHFEAARAFTLLELLVVMFIVGIIAAMATLSVGVATSGKGTEKEIDRIEDLLNLASELLPEVRGVSI